MQLGSNDATKVKRVQKVGRLFYNNERTDDNNNNKVRASRISETERRPEMVK